MNNTRAMETNSKIISNYPLIARDFVLKIDYNVICYTGPAQEIFGKITIYIDNVEKKVFNKVFKKGTLNYTVEVGSLAEGTHTIKVRCICSHNRDEILTFTVDRSQPKVDLSAETIGQLQAGVYPFVIPHIAVTGVYKYNMTVKLVKDGVVIPYTFGAPIEEEGNYQLSVRVTALNGLSDERTVSFKIEK